MKRFVFLVLHLDRKSHPTWVRGLKLSCTGLAAGLTCVAPYVGAWIETKVWDEPPRGYWVAPYVGAWIETLEPRPS